MKILAFNSGSSSIKYSAYDTDKDYTVLLKGSVDRIGQQNDFQAAIEAIQQKLLEQKIVIDAVGHRIVHGGERYRDPVIIDDDVIAHLKETAKFDPLHFQPNILGIEVLRKLLPNVPHVAVFDTAVHATMEAKAFLYGIPIEYYEKYKLRRYGFHGINHSYVAHEAAKKALKPIETLKIVTCHLGNGCSITAFKNGKSIDNSMGLTPLEGLVMGSRSGDLDPAVVLYLIEELGMKAADVNELLNKKSGLKGLCGKSDMRDIIQAASEGDKLSQTAIEVFVYRIQKYIGAFIAALNGVDVIVFTGGIGENSPEIRARIIKNFGYVNACLDMEKNERNESVFSLKDSSVLLMTIPANEELSIAQQTNSLLS